MKPKEIKARRKSLEMTQEHLAEKAGVSQAQIAKLELGKADPAFSTMVRILDALKIRVRLIKSRI